MSNTDGKDPTRVAAGLKAATHNPNVSQEAKDDAAERLQQIETSKPDDNAANPNRVLGGYKATLKNPNASEEAKEHAQEVLEENNA